MSEEKTIVYSRDGEVFYDNEGIIQEARDDWEEGEEGRDYRRNVLGSWKYAVIQRCPNEETQHKNSLLNL